MARRTEKAKYLAILKLMVMTGRVSGEQGGALEAAFRRARTPKDFIEVSRALDLAVNGWKTDGDVYSHLLRNANDD